MKLVGWFDVMSSGSGKLCVTWQWPR